MTWLWVALGGGLGAVLRHLASVGAVRAGAPSAAATLAVNWLGSFLIGLVSGLGPRFVPPAVAVPLTVGVLGGFTTFSTASVDAAQLWRDGRRGAAVGLATLMLLGSVLAWVVGWWVVTLAVGTGPLRQP